MSSPAILTFSSEFLHHRGIHVSDLVTEDSLAKNLLNWDIPGVVVFRGYAWSYETSIDFHHIDVLENVDFGPGLKRTRCDHVGSFTMNGRRQSNMASASIGQAPGRGRNHIYWDPKCINPSLLPLDQNIINLISSEAM